MKIYRFKIPRELDFEVMNFVKEQGLTGAISSSFSDVTVFHLSIPEDLVLLMKLKYNLKLTHLPELNND